MTLEAERWRRLLVCLALSAAAAVWCAATLLPPLLHRAGHEEAALLATLPFRLVCHQIADRSFHLAGVPIAVCARCAGLYAGFLAGCLTLGWMARPTGRPRPTPPSPPPHRRVLILSALPTLAQVALEQGGALPAGPAGITRGLTGAMLGFVVSLYFLPAIQQMGEELIGGRMHAEAS